jgi:hypothetical protein
VNLGKLWDALVTILASSLGGGAFYVAWMAVFLMAQVNHSALNAVLWLMAPVATGTGFALGVVAIERLRSRGATPFWRILVWPLAGCALGAGAVYWLGPMLIVFGMLAAGAASITLREALRLRGIDPS